jgi:hypothetical protein
VFSLDTSFEASMEKYGKCEAGGEVKDASSIDQGEKFSIIPSFPRATFDVS